MRLFWCFNAVISGYAAFYGGEGVCERHFYVETGRFICFFVFSVFCVVCFCVKPYVCSICLEVFVYMGLYCDVMFLLQCYCCGVVALWGVIIVIPSFVVWCCQLVERSIIKT